MPRRFLSLLVLGLTLVPSPARPADADQAAPAVVVHIRSVDDLIAAGVHFYGQVSDTAEAQKFVDKTFTDQLGPKGLDGLDRKRPLGLYVVLKDNPILSDLVLAVPVTGEREFLDLLDRAHVKVEKVEGGLYGLVLPGVPLPVYFRIADHHAYFTVRDGSAIGKGKVLRPSDLVPADEKALVAIRLSIDRIPDGLRQSALALFDRFRGEALKAKNPGESAAEFAARKAVVAKLELKLRQFVLTGREAALRMDDNLNVDVSVAADPGSHLARDFAALSRTRSRFAGLQPPGAVMRMGMTFPLPDDVRKAVMPAFEEEVRKGLQNEPDASMRALTRLFVQAFTQTLQSGHLDLGVALLKGAGDRHATLVGGVAVEDGAAIDRAFRDLVGKLPEGQRGKVHLDAKTVGSVKVHELDEELLHSGNEKDNEGRREMFGKGPGFVAVAPDAVVFGMGPRGLKELTKALELKPATSRPFDLFVSLPAVGELVGAGNREYREVTRKLGVVRVRIEGGEALRLHIDGFAAAVVGLMPRARAR